MILAASTSLDRRTGWAQSLRFDNCMISIRLELHTRLKIIDPGEKARTVHYSGGG